MIPIEVWNRVLGENSMSIDNTIKPVKKHMTLRQQLEDANAEIGILYETVVKLRRDIKAKDANILNLERAVANKSATIVDVLTYLKDLEPRTDCADTWSNSNNG